MRLLARLLAAVLTLLLVAVLAVALIASTESGLQWSYRVAGMILPGELHIDELRGRLTGPLRVRGLHYAYGATELDIGRVELEWNSADLLSATLHIKRFVLDDFTLTYAEPPPRPDQPKEPFSLPTVTLPFYLRADHIELNRLLVRERTQGPKFELIQASLAATWRGDRGEIEQLTVHAPRYQISVSGSIEAAADYPLDLEVNWRFDAGDYAVWDGEGRLHGNLKKLEVDQRVHAPVAVAVKGSLSEPVEAPAWNATVAASEFDLRAIHAAWPEMRIGGVIRSSGRVNDLEARASGTLRTLYNDIPLTHTLDLVFHDHNLTVQRLRSIYADTATEVYAAGRITGLGAEPRAELTGGWRHVRWPLRGDATVESLQGRFRLDGGLTRYNLAVQGDLTGKNVPRSAWNVAASGTQEALTLSKLNGDVLEGHVSGSGEVRWRPDLHIALALQADGINPGAQWPAWPGSVHVAGNVTAGMLDDKLEVKLDLPDIHGRLLDNDFTGVTHARMHDERIELAQFDVQSGVNRVTASGRLDQQWDMAWSLTADQLSALLPDVSGAFHGGGRVTGPRAAPVFTTSLRGENLAMPDYSAAEVRLVASLDSSGEVPSTFDLEAGGLTLKTQVLDRLALRVDGTTGDHAVRAEVATAAAQLVLSARGGYADQQWEGDLLRLDLSEDHIGRWSLRSETHVVAGAHAARVEALCLLRATASMCASGQWQPEQGWQARATGRGLPLNLLLSFLPPNSIIRGDMGFDVQAEADAAGFITAKFSVDTSAGAVSETLTRRQGALDVAFRGGRLSGGLDADALQVKLDFGLEKGGAITGNFRALRRGLPAPVGGGETSDPAVLSGRLDASLTDLTALPLFIAAVENTGGRFDLGVQVSGAWEAPQVTGAATLADASAELPAFGITLQALYLNLRSHDRRHVSLEGSVRSGTGTLNLRGDARQNDDNVWSAEVTAKGERVDVMHTSEMHIIASPDLKLTLRGQRVELGGDILIPEALIQPRELKGAVSASDDVILMTGDERTTPKSLWQIYTNVRVRLGDFVRFNGFGLRARLAGEVVLKDEPEQPTTATGELRVTEGEYRAYGQELTIDRGRLLFFGGPVDNPGLDVRAVRHVEEVTAGLLVRGTLKNPEVTIFSEPAMAETDALSYLVLGRPMSQATRAEGQQMYGAAAALGLLGGGLLSNQLGKRFGIDDVRIESGGGFGGGALVIRHYLSPKLYVSYGMGLFENLSVFIVRYQISKLWALQAESGAQSSADIIYTIERN